MAAESSTQRAIWLAAGALAGVILFRVNSGKAWLSGGGKPVRLKDGSVVVPAARPVALGMSLVSGDPVVGQSDLMGWRTITITQEMVGKTCAIFTSVECKRSDGGRTSKDQIHWIERVLKSGGFACVASSPEEAERKLSEQLLCLRSPTAI